MAGLNDLEGLQARSVLQETVFRSHVPLIGPLIAWLRSAWNNVSTTWYVRPLIAQQNEFNALVAGQLRRVAEQINSQEAQLSELNHRVGELEGRLRDLSAWLIAQDREHSELVHDLAELRVQLGRLRKALAEMSGAMPQGEADDEERSG